MSPIIGIDRSFEFPYPAFRGTLDTRFYTQNAYMKIFLCEFNGC